MIEKYFLRNHYILFSFKNKKGSISSIDTLYLFCFILVYFTLSDNLGNDITFFSLIIYSILIISLINIRYYIVNKDSKSIYDLLKYIMGILIFTIVIYLLTYLLLKTFPFIKQAKGIAVTFGLCSTSIF